jgi:hypothetical protein
MVKLKETEKKLIFMNIKELGEFHAAFYTSLGSILQNSISGQNIFG